MPESTSPAVPRPTCPKCHLPIRAGEAKISYLSHFYHRHCAPPMAQAGDKDDPYKGETPIAI